VITIEPSFPDLAVASALEASAGIISLLITSWHRISRLSISKAPISRLLTAALLSHQNATGQSLRSVKLIINKRTKLWDRTDKPRSCPAAPKSKPMPGVAAIASGFLQAPGNSAVYILNSFIQSIFLWIFQYIKTITTYGKSTHV